MEDIIWRWGDDATLCMIRRRRPRAKRGDVEGANEVEVPQRRDAAPHWKVAKVGPGGCGLVSIRLNWSWSELLVGYNSSDGDTIVENLRCQFFGGKLTTKDTQNDAEE